MAATTTGGVIDGSGLTKSWGSTSVLRGLDFTIGAGITGLLGSNGTGKTTLLGMVLGLHPPDGGTLRVLGEDPESSGPELRTLIGYSPEHHELPPDVQAADLVRHIAQLHGLPRKAATERASDALWLVGLGEERFRAIGTMSTGQRQRVKLAQALAHDPALILLDEPTDGLDPVQRDHMLELIRRIGTEFGIDIVLSSHLLGEVEQVCDGVLILADGLVRQSGSLRDLEAFDDRRGYVVEVDDPQVLATALAGVGLETSIDGSVVIVTGPGDLNDLIRDAVVDASLALRRLEPNRKSLEDVYLETGP